MTSPTPSGSETTSPGSTLQLSASQSASLSAQFRYYEETRLLDVRYELSNQSAQHALAVFDRGAEGPTLDAVGPTGNRSGLLALNEGGDVTLTFDVEASGKLSAEFRILALELAAGGSLKADLWRPFEGDAPLRRARLCIPVATFVAAHYQGVIQSSDGPVRVAGPEALGSRQLLCSPWVELTGDAEWRG